MNDFYEQKANKYKYKYLELKKRIEYNGIGGVYNGIGGGYNGIGGVGGVGCFGNFCKNFGILNSRQKEEIERDKIKKAKDDKIQKSYDNLSQKDKDTFISLNNNIKIYNEVEKTKHHYDQQFMGEYNHQRFFTEYCLQLSDHGDYIQYNCKTEKEKLKEDEAKHTQMLVNEANKQIQREIEIKKREKENLKKYGPSGPVRHTFHGNNTNIKV